MGVTCLVTIHGIGFQQPPGPGVAGCADALHKGLAVELPGELSSDPTRAEYQEGESVPIYVCSRWPPDGGSRGAGLARLGAWMESTGDARIDASKAPLVQAAPAIAPVVPAASQLDALGAQPL